MGEGGEGGGARGGGGQGEGETMESITQTKAETLSRAVGLCGVGQVESQAKLSLDIGR